jgi:uncharacterized RDD family membrane protein YckC
MIIIAGRKKNLAKRYYANFFDYSILFMLIGLYIFLMGDQDESGSYKVTGFKALLIPVVWLFYFPFCESIFGQTIGKKVFHLYIVDLKGDTPTIVQTFLRRLLDLIEIMFLGIPALLTINHSEKNQRIGDMVAGTTVVITDAVCRLCGTELELTPKEVIRDSFRCPNCNEIN